MFLAPTAVSFSRNVHPETSGSACASLHKISTGSGVTLYCLHMMWNKRCSSAMLLYGERVVFQGNYQGHFYMKYGLSLHLWWHPNWSFAESKKTSLDETLSWNSIGEKIQWVPGNLVSHCLWQISVKWMLSWRQRSPWPTCSLQQGHFLGTSQGKAFILPDIWGTSTGCKQCVCELWACQTSLSASTPWCTQAFSKGFGGISHQLSYQLWLSHCRCARCKSMLSVLISLFTHMLLLGNL